MIFPNECTIVYMVSYEKCRTLQRLTQKLKIMNDLIDEITEMAFFLGSEANESNASIVAGFIGTLYKVREYLKSEE